MYIQKGIYIQIEQRIDRAERASFAVSRTSVAESALMHALAIRL